MEGIIGNEGFTRSGRDDTTNSTRTISNEHGEIHEGKHFTYKDAISLDSGSSQAYMVTTPNTTEWAHMNFYFDGTAITQVQIYEGSDKAGVTPLTPINRNRNIANEPSTTIHKGTSGGSTDGVLLPLTYKSGTATNQSRSPTTIRSENELVLRQNCKYIIILTSGTNGNLVNAIFDWYEHTNEKEV